ncbi:MULTISPECIES: flavin-containing monooxygenase [Phenylobacterium]|uniref:Cation diffusion facilitator CzcD-associated flavoprotein CzcO n=1 Tax=Phenylobacterium koreense TaxID=266125 RepID=A0ABV2EFH0_9CAUL
MNTHTAASTRERSTEVQHFDVLIVGAGIAGVGAAYHLQTQDPGRTFKVLEAQAGFGGTWRTHKYPGVRSDSDLHTFGYRFKPWQGAPIATGQEILSYMAEVIEENDLARHIQYQTHIQSARWSSQDGLWHVEARRLDTGVTEHYSANFLWMCQGYYRHTEGYTPEWPGMADFKGRIVHPQTWPEDLDWRGKRIVVIGSGATAATLIPALADEAAHVTMLQRSPTYFTPGRNRNELAETLRELDIDPDWTHEIVRRSILLNSAKLGKRREENPELVREELLGVLRKLLGDEYVAKHFTPSYAVWRQRICFVPNGDFFESIKAGKASVVTDTIDRFTEAGIQLSSGETLDADIIVTATGFNLNVLGDIQFSIDNEPLDLSKTVTYRGMMFTGVPNLIWVFGYFRASWTLRADLIGDFVPRLLKHMDAKGSRSVTVALRPEDQEMPLGDWIDQENFNPGYLMRGMHLMPRSGAKREWRHTQDYWSEKDEFPLIDLDDRAFVYG